MNGIKPRVLVSILLLVLKTTYNMRRDGFFDGLLVGLRALTSDNRSWRVAHMNGRRKTLDLKSAALALLY